MKLFKVKANKKKINLGWNMFSLDYIREVRMTNYLIITPTIMGALLQHEIQ